MLRAALPLIRREEPERLVDLDSNELPTAGDMATVSGAGPVGRQIASHLEIMGRDVCSLDLSPIDLHPFALERFRTIVGNATRRDVLQSAKVAGSELVVDLSD